MGPSMSLGADGADAAGGFAPGDGGRLQRGGDAGGGQGVSPPLAGGRMHPGAQAHAAQVASVSSGTPTAEPKRPPRPNRPISGGSSVLSKTPDGSPAPGVEAKIQLVALLEHGALPLTGPSRPWLLVGWRASS